mgnify:CR=1 FL=1
MNSYGEEKVPDIDHLKYNGYRKGKMNEVLTALNRLHNKEDYNEQYRRNPDTYQLLKDIEIIHPVVTEALEMERQMFFNMLSDVAAARLMILNKGTTEVRVGSWWHLLTNKCNKIFLSTGPVTITLDPHSNDSTVYYEGEGYSATMDRDRIYIK